MIMRKFRNTPRYSLIARTGIQNIKKKQHVKCINETFHRLLFLDYFFHMHSYLDVLFSAWNIFSPRALHAWVPTDIVSWNHYEWLSGWGYEWFPGSLQRTGRAAIVCRQGGGLVEAGVLQVRCSAGRRYRPEDSAMKVCCKILLHPHEEKDCILKPGEYLAI